MSCVAGINSSARDVESSTADVNSITGYIKFSSEDYTQTLNMYIAALEM